MSKAKEDEVFDKALWKSVEAVDEVKGRRPIPTRPEKTPEQLEQEAQERARKLKEKETEYMENHVAKLKDDAEKASTEYERIARLQQEFPGLRQQTDRWKNVRYKSASVNSLCDSYEFIRSCGCCPDPAIWAQPYVNTALGKIFSDPYQFYVGEGRTHSWIHEEHGWERKMQEAGIPGSVITDIRNHLDAELREADEDKD